MNRLTIAALFLGACSGAHLPPVPAPTSTGAKSGLRPWTCTTPVGAIVLELPEAHGLPLVGISATVLVSGARVTTGCERSEPAAPASTAPDATVSAAPTAAPDVGKLAPESQP
jgi:PBP1b-binding outer membrane lipoprotein LpoB